jgi:hypothetical protein
MSLPARFPFKTLLIVGLLCFVVVKNPPLSVRFASAKDLDDYQTEFYPLSAFPMYSGFTDVEIYVFLTDQNDKPLRLADFPNCQASALKKHYKSVLDDWKKATRSKLRTVQAPDDIKAQAGRETLRHVVMDLAPEHFSADPGRIIRLHEGMLRREGSKIAESTRMVAEGSRSSLEKFKPEEFRGGKQ